MKPSIRVQGLGKCYRIRPGSLQPDYHTLRETLRGIATYPLQLLRGARGDRTEEFWALRDVDFAIEPGDVVGIIGRNGAGKSTLLKMLSRITRPTTGEIELNGRVGSLLEVGTGFHPELTGRENIYLNGAILGMTRREVRAKFDEIVAFSELEKFLDTPIKLYSSGMYVRLAFSVAAHINPEILLVDEVLAVGDVAFQAKCLGKLGDVVRGGRTVLFVSHQLESMLNLCPTALWFDRGRLVEMGDAREVINRYLANQRMLMNTPLGERTDRTGGHRMRFTDTWVEDAQGNRVLSVLAGQPIKLVATYELARGEIVRRPDISFALYTPHGTPVTRFLSRVTGDLFEELPPRGRFECFVPRLPLNIGEYVYNLLAESGPDFDVEDWVLSAGVLRVEQGDFFGGGKLIEPKFPVLVEHSWKLCGD